MPLSCSSTDLAKSRAWRWLPFLASIRTSPSRAFAFVGARTRTSRKRSSARPSFPRRVYACARLSRAPTRSGFASIARSRKVVPSAYFCCCKRIDPRSAYATGLLAGASSASLGGGPRLLPDRLLASIALTVADGSRDPIRLVLEEQAERLATPMKSIEGLYVRAFRALRYSQS